MIEVRKLHKKYMNMPKRKLKILLISYKCCQCNTMYSELYEIKLQSIYIHICTNCLVEMLLELQKIGFVFKK